MLTDTTGGPTAHTLTHQITTLQHELQRIYAKAFTPALNTATEFQRRFEPPDGSGPLDPIHAADIAGCRAVNTHLPGAIARHLPGAQLLERPEDSATVIDSRWLYQQSVVVIEWDHGCEFGDPNALTVREVIR